MAWMSDYFYKNLRNLLIIYALTTFDIYWKRRPHEYFCPLSDGITPDHRVLGVIERMIALRSLRSLYYQSTSGMINISHIFNRLMVALCVLCVDHVINRFTRSLYSSHSFHFWSLSEILLCVWSWFMLGRTLCGMITGISWANHVYGGHDIEQLLPIGR